MLSVSPLISVVEIGLERPLYTVNETDGTIEVCAVLVSGSLERTVTVSLSTVDGTAKGRTCRQTEWQVNDS